MNSHIKILNTEFNDPILNVYFNDETVKSYHVNDAFEISDKSIFEKIKIINNSRALEFKNGSDYCADWLRYYAKDLNEEWENINEDIPLSQRIQMTRIAHTK